MCLHKGYLTGQPAGRFRYVTTGWQWLGNSRGAGSFVNTRKDDVAYVKTNTGMVICLRPGDVGGIFPDAGATAAIRISYSSRC